MWPNYSFDRALRVLGEWPGPRADYYARALLAGLQCGAVHLEG